MFPICTPSVFFGQPWLFLELHRHANKQTETNKSSTALCCIKLHQRLHPDPRWYSKDHKSHQCWSTLIGNTGFNGRCTQVCPQNHLPMVEKKLWPTPNGSPQKSQRHVGNLKRFLWRCGKTTFPSQNYKRLTLADFRKRWYQKSTGFRLWEGGCAVQICFFRWYLQFMVFIVPSIFDRLNVLHIYIYSKNICTYCKSNLLQIRKYT